MSRSNNSLEKGISDFENYSIVNKVTNILDLNRAINPFCIKDAWVNLS